MTWRFLRSARPRRQRGAALLAAIACAGVLSALAVEIVAIAQDDILLAESFRDEFRVRWALRAPVAVAMAALKEDAKTAGRFSEKWGDRVNTLTVEGVVVHFRLHDEASKVNLNALASEKAAVRETAETALKGIFRRLNLDASLVDSLRRLREGRPAEASTPPAGGGPAPAPKPILRSLSELKLVQGFTPAVLRSLGFQARRGEIEADWSGLVTIFSGERVNVNTADPFILRELSADLPEFFVQDLVDRRKERPIENLAQLKQIPGMTEPLFNKLSPFLSVQSQFFSVTAEAETGRVRRRLTAVLESGKDGLGVRYWRIR